MPGVVSVPEWQSVQGAKHKADAISHEALGATAISRRAQAAMALQGRCADGRLLLEMKQAPSRGAQGPP